MAASGMKAGPLQEHERCFISQVSADPTWPLANGLPNTEAFFHLLCKYVKLLASHTFTSTRRSTLLRGFCCGQAVDGAVLDVGTKAAVQTQTVGDEEQARPQREQEASLSCEMSCQFTKTATKSVPGKQSKARQQGRVGAAATLR